MPPHLFANHTFVITSLAGFVVGVAMFGAIVFLPQYLQIVKGQSPTASGLLTLPLMVGLLGASIGVAATLAVGVLTFALQRKLPYRRMLIATGVLIAVGIGLWLITWLINRAIYARKTYLKDPSDLDGDGPS